MLSPSRVSKDVCLLCDLDWADHEDRRNDRLNKRMAELDLEELDIEDCIDLVITAADCVELLRNASRGPRGPQGFIGPAGMPGPAGLSGR